MKLIDLLHRLLADLQAKPSLQHQEVVETYINAVDPNTDTISYTLEVH